MLVEKITSRQNPLVKRFRRVCAGSERHLIFLEGIRLVEEAIRTGVHFENIAYTSDVETTDRGLSLLDSLEQVHCRGANLTKQVMCAITDTETPQGIIALVGRPVFEMAQVAANRLPLVVIADGLQDPGNLGAVIRTSEAAGATGLIATRNTVDAFGPKALRASMGAALRLPVITDAVSSEVVTFCREHKIVLIAARPESPGLKDSQGAGKAHTEIDLSRPVALVFGRESSGIPEETASAADERVYIPMADGVESLNVAAAAAILLYEAARQRSLTLGKGKTRGRKKE